MERNYLGQGGYSAGTQSSLVSSGRRAGTVRSTSGDEGSSVGYSPHGSDAGTSSHVPRFGRRASPGSTPTGSGMDMDPPKQSHPNRPVGGTIPRSLPTGSVAPSPGVAGPSGSAGGVGTSKLAGLQRLKEASTARLVSRIPSANGRTSGETGGYVPSALTNPQATRNLPARTNSGSHSGSSSFGSGATNGSAAAGYGNSIKPRSSSGAARSASTGPAISAAGRPPSGRSTGSAAAAGSSGYGGSNARQQQQPAATTAAGSYGNGAAARGSAAANSNSRQPPAVPAAAARRQAVGAPTPLAAAPAPPPEPQSRPTARAPPPPARHHRHSEDEFGYGGGGGVGFGGSGGGGFGGSGGGFMSGSIPPGAEEDVPSGPMVDCPSCGRRFNEQAYSKHAKICEKVFATKRKPVNMAAKRLEGTEAVKFFDVRKGVPKFEAKQQQQQGPAGGRGLAGRGGGRGGGGGGFDERPLPGSKLPKWKAQSEQLRAAMATNRKIVDAKARGMDIKDIKFDSGPAAPDDRVQCPHCGRKFAELTAERHIPKCKDIMAKPGRLAAGGGRGAHMRR